MKTTVEIDEKKLLQVMKQGGFKTRREAIAYALTEAEKKMRLRALESKPFYVTDDAVMAPEYDLRSIRAKDIAGHEYRH